VSQVDFSGAAQVLVSGRPDRLSAPMPRNPDIRRRHVFARNLRTARLRAHLTQVDLAEAMEMSETVYARYEAGMIWPTPDSLRRLCRILRCSADWLLDLDDTPGPAPAPPPAEPAALRRVLRQLRQAQPGTQRMVTQLLDQLEARGRLAPPDEDE
jgi:transcriptional regulator with XRE-family HTH domain